MAKKAAPKKPAPKKKPTNAVALPPMKKAAAPAKSHERNLKTSEADRIANGRKLAAAYLVARDGMDEEMADMIVDGMESGEINDLIAEANSAVIERNTNGDANAAQADTAALVEPEPEPEKEFVDFLTVPALAEHEEFSQWVLDCIEASTLKNKKEKEYKEIKKKIISAMRESGNDLVSVFGTNLEAYKGVSPKQLDPVLLLEKGVSIDIINACYKSTEYDDVRIAVPKEAK